MKKGDQAEYSPKEKIKLLMEDRGWSMYKLAAESGMSYSSLNNSLNRSNDPSLSTIRAVCKAFDISISEFFSDVTPIQSKTDYSAEEKKLIKEFRELSRSEKNLLFAYMAGLKHKLP